jgi:hypothetical protein
MTRIISQDDRENKNWTKASVNWETNFPFMKPASDKQLRELAKKRVEFRTHLVVYVVINSVLWLIWYFTGATYPWPIWPLAGWGVGLFFHYMFEYSGSKVFSVEDEYEKLRSKREEIH